MNIRRGFFYLSVGLAGFFLGVCTVGLLLFLMPIPHPPAPEELRGFGQFLVSFSVLVLVTVLLANIWTLPLAPARAMDEPSE